jgi:uncharacterized cofD-like protein
MLKKRKKHIVCLGGGNAMPKAVLAGLKKYPVKISAICAMLDSGGSAGRLRKDYKIVSPGDIRRAFLALANTSPVIESLFNFRFQAGDLKDHNFANLFITALELSSNNYEKTSQEIKRILNVRHEVLPITLENANVFAVLENGKVIKGETNIDIPKHNGNLKIKKVYLKPKARVYAKAANAIKNADLIVIGPGDLYSSLAQILLTDGVSRALKKSKGKIVYVCNLMTKYGETNNFSVSDFANEIEKFLGQKPNYVIYNNKKPSAARLAVYKKQHPELLNLVGFDRDSAENKKLIGTDILTDSGGINHDPKKLAKIILSI